MSDEIRINRPQAQQPVSTNVRPDNQPQSDMGKDQQNGSKMAWIILGIIVLALIAAGVLFRDKLFKGLSGRKPSAGTAQSSGFQAVFLTNGQVYFGKLSNPDGNYLTLKDIYYLQVGPQQGSGTDAAGAPAPAQQQSISLVKLGQELHGPVDEMHISRTQVLFYEDLKFEGSVVKAIEAYKANPTGTPSVPAK